MNPRTVLAVAVCTALIAGCGGDDDSTSTTAGTSTTTGTSTAASTTAVSTTPGPTATTVSPPSTATPTTAVAPTEAPATVGRDEVLISVTIGVDSSSDRVEHVPLGSTVVLEMTDPNTDQEFHIHDYDLGGNTEVPAGTTARFTFVADRAGEFEVESHVTDDVLVVLEVS